MTYNQQAEDFIMEYGGTNFSDVRFRGESSAQFTTKFGIDLGTRLKDALGNVKPLRLHCGIDRGNGANGQIIVPFDCEKTEFIEHPSFGSIIRLFVKDVDFEVRIMHCDPEGDIPAGMLKRLKNGSSIRTRT